MLINRKLTLVLLLLSLLNLNGWASPENRDYKTKFGYSDKYGVVTPTDVYSLVENINAIILVLAEKKYPDKLNKIRAIQSKSFQNKRPEDVFVLMQKLADAVDKVIIVHSKLLVKRIQREKKLAIPAEVYLQASTILDTISVFMKVKQIESKFGRFYTVHQYKDNKTPSDVYGKVLLAFERVKLFA